MKIAVCTLWTPEVEAYAKIGVGDKRQYCDAHGYDLITSDKTLDPSRPPSWSKLLLMDRELVNYDWLCWMDADTIIMDHSRRLEEFVVDGHDMIVGVDSNHRMPNCGVMLIKNTKLSSDLLYRWWHHQCDYKNPIWEQRAFFDLLGSGLLPCVSFVPARAFNSYYFLYEPGDFLIHFTGQHPLPNTEDRAKMMGEYFSRRKLADLVAA